MLGFAHQVFTTLDLWRRSSVSPITLQSFFSVSRSSSSTTRFHRSGDRTPPCEKLCITLPLIEVSSLAVVTVIITRQLVIKSFPSFYEGTYGEPPQLPSGLPVNTLLSLFRSPRLIRTAHWFLLRGFLYSYFFQNKDLGLIGRKSLTDTNCLARSSFENFPAFFFPGSKYITEC